MAGSNSTKKATKKCKKASIDMVMGIYFNALEQMKTSFERKSVKNMIRNIKRESNDNDEIYEHIANLFPLLGCPLQYSTMNRCNNQSPK